MAYLKWTVLNSKTSAFRSLLGTCGFHNHDAMNSLIWPTIVSAIQFFCQIQTDRNSKCMWKLMTDARMPYRICQYRVPGNNEISIAIVIWILENQLMNVWLGDYLPSTRFWFIYNFIFAKKSTPFFLRHTNLHLFTVVSPMRNGFW